MNVLEYLNLEIDLNLTASEAFEQYKSTPNTVITSFEYFRTKYNNLKRNKGIKIEQPTKINKHKGKDDLEKHIDKNLSLGVLKITNYEDDFKIDLTDPIPTGTAADLIISKRGGVMRKCVDVKVGKPGAGKTWLCNALAVEAKEYNPNLKIRFICAEMRESEWLEEVAADPWLKNVEVVYMLNYVGKANYLQILVEALKGCDIAVVDSFPVILHHIMLVAERGVTEKRAIFDLIDLFIQAAEVNNQNIQLINQVLKDGNYKGGTELPHMTSSLAFVKTEGNKRYFEYEKNRNNGRTIHRRLYFSKDKERENRITFDLEAYNATYEVKEDTKTDIATFLRSINKKTPEVVENQLDLEASISEIESENENLLQ